MSKLKKLIIVGAGNSSREVLQIVKDVNRESLRFDVIGFIADTGQDIKSLTNGEYDVIGTIDQWQPKSDEYFVAAIADPKGREFVVKKLESRGAQFISLIHPTVLISDYCQIGKGLIAYAHALIGPNTVLGDHVFLQRTSIGHDAKIGSFVTISSLCGILGSVEVGDKTFIGNHATLVPGIKVGEEAFVGAGSVVIRNVKSGTKVFGNPARRVSL